MQKKKKIYSTKAETSKYFAHEDSSFSIVKWKNKNEKKKERKKKI